MYIIKKEEGEEEDYQGTSLLIYLLSDLYLIAIKRFRENDREGRKMFRRPTCSTKCS